MKLSLMLCRENIGMSPEALGIATFGIDLDVGREQ
jgi:hypothetical protein